MGTSNSTNHGQPVSASGEAIWLNQSAGVKGSLLEWWYRLAAPQEPEHSTSYDRERVRAGRLSSIILLLMFCFGLTLLPTALNSMSVNHLFLIILLVAMTINLSAFVLNRQGLVMLVGIFMVITVEISFITITLTSPLGLTTRSLTTFELIILTELMAVSLLPPKSVFLLMLCNNAFTWAAITFMHHTPDLILSPLSAYYSVLASPLILQIIVAIVTYLWVQGARQAIARAEQVAELEHAIAERDREVAEQKVQLEQGIQQILQTQIQAANGNFEVRAPLARDNVLWQVARNLNNLLSRLQRASQAENELQRVDMEVRRLVEAVRNARTWHRPVQAARSGTALDPLVQELNGNAISQQP
ncbi:MAG TPA: hypothetical protein VGD98_22900 [Ktedonobacteraceae bacterium]